MSNLTGEFDELHKKANKIRVGLTAKYNSAVAGHIITICLAECLVAGTNSLIKIEAMLNQLKPKILALAACKLSEGSNGK